MAAVRLIECYAVPVSATDAAAADRTSLVTSTLAPPTFASVSVGRDSCFSCSDILVSFTLNEACAAGGIGVEVTTILCDQTVFGDNYFCVCYNIQIPDQRSLV